MFGDGILSVVLGVVFWGFLIVSAIGIIIKNPIRGTAKVISYIFPFLIGFGLPIYLAMEFKLTGWFVAAVLIGSWILAGAYISIHCRFFPEDNEKGS